jgi:hypothetical protein
VEVVAVVVDEVGWVVVVVVVGLEVVGGWCCSRTGDGDGDGEREGDVEEWFSLSASMIFGRTRPGPLCGRTSFSGDMLARRSARSWACVSGESVLVLNPTTRPGVLGLRGERKDDLPGDAARGSGLSWAGAEFDSSSSYSSSLGRIRGRWDDGLNVEKKAET